MEASSEEIRLGETEGRESKGRGRKEMRGERQGKKSEKRENSRNKESGRRMEDLG